MDETERINLSQIELLNQRGGATLSVVHLMRAGTISPEMAAYAMCALAGGASLLTAARSSGAGKTTLMAALLAFLPPGERLRTVGAAASRVPRGRTDHGRECLLCHEIGSGPYFGYLWGSAARVFFAAVRRGVRIATNVHAQDMADLVRELCGPALGVPPEDVRSLGVVAFMQARRSPEGMQRRVVRFCGAAEGDARVLWQWEPASDTFVWCGGQSPDQCVPEGPVAYARALEFLRDLHERGPDEYAACRESIRSFLLAEAPA